MLRIFLLIMLRIIVGIMFKIYELFSDYKIVIDKNKSNKFGN